MSFYSFQTRQARPVIPKNAHGYKGFESLNELIEPKLRPSAEVNTVGKLIRHTFKQLEKTLKRAFVLTNKCTVYFPWSHNSWAFALFTPGNDVKALLTQLALEFKQKYHGKESIRVILNQYDPKNPATNYRQLVNERSNLLVFGDNVSGKGLGGSAAIRNNPNAFGMPTGWLGGEKIWPVDKEAVLQQRMHTFEAFFGQNEHQILYTGQQQLKQNQAMLISKLKNMNSLQQNLMAREHAIGQREELLKQRENELRVKETTLSRREALINRRETLKHVRKN